MANHPSALKKHRRDEKKRLINKVNRSKMKTQIKLLRKKAAAGEKEEVKKLFPQVVSVIDHTVRKGTIHAKTGSRYKSRLAQLMQKTGA